MSATVSVTEADLSPEFKDIISKVLQQHEPLDDPNFNSTDYINRMFPSGLSFECSI